MLELVKKTIDAHGGLDRWNQIQQISVNFSPNGLGFVMRGHEAFTRQSTRVTIRTQKQEAQIQPFLAPDQQALFEPNYVAVKLPDGTVKEELADPRPSFIRLNKQDPWTACQLAYFAGYAMWTYLTLPFSLVFPDIHIIEGTPYTENGETWRTLDLIFPPSFVTHSSLQRLYIDEQGLIRRHDYTVDISNGSRAAHYLYDHQSFDGIIFPTKRRIYPNSDDLTPQREVVIFSADLNDFRLD